MRTKSFLICVLLCFGSCVKQDPNSSLKILNTPMVSDIKGFDPILSGDAYTNMGLQQVYEGLLEYEYLKRPYTLRPLLAESMPTISKDGLTYTFVLRKGVRFQEDSAFGGNPRFLKSSDVIFSLQRLADPHSKGPNGWVLENRIQGLDEFQKKVAQLPSSPSDYKAFPVSGLQTPDDQTLVIRLTKPNRQFLFSLAMPATFVVAPEVVQKYGNDFLNHPVGTGPFLLKEWKRNQKIVFQKNPTYWGSTYPSEGEPEDQVQGRLKDAGKKLPFLDQLVFWIYVESQPQWLNFLKGNLDVSSIPKEAFENVIDPQGQLTQKMKEKQIQLEKFEGLDVVFFLFNMEDPLLGKNKFLRQAISSAINREDKISLFYNQRAIVAHGILPPGIFGYDPNLKDPWGFDLDRAKRLMVQAKEEFHANGGKGEIPSIVRDIIQGTAERQMSEAVTQDLDRIGLATEVRPWTWPQLMERMSKKQIQMVFYAWNADYPDPENFFQLLYSKNKSPGPNRSNFSHAEYDRLFEEMREMQDGPERLKRIQRMVQIIHEYTPIGFFNHRIAYALRHPWVQNAKGHGIVSGLFKYYDLDLDQKQKMMKHSR